MAKTGIKRPPVYRISLVQSATIVLMSLVLMDDLVFAYSLVLGGMIAIIPQMYFAARVFRQSGAQSAKAIARASYAGEVGKFALAAAGFAVVFAGIEPIEGLAVFAGYLTMVFIQICGSWFLLR